MNGVTSPSSTSRISAAKRREWLSASSEHQAPSLSAERMTARWSPQDDHLLRGLYADQLPINQIAVRVGRSADAVTARRHTLGIPARRRSNPWSSKDDALLRAACTAGVPASALALRLGRSTDQVRARRRKLVTPQPAARRYLPQEDEAIRLCLREQGDLAELARLLRRSPDALRLHARHLGLFDPSPRRRWAQWEDAAVRDGYTSALPCAEIARQLPHRGPTSVAARAGKLGLVTYARCWSAQDDQRLRLLAARGASLEHAAQRLGRTPEAIRRRAARLGTRSPAAAVAPRRGRRWTAYEDELLRLHHALNPARLAQLLGRSDAAVCRRLCALGLRRHANRSPHHPVTRSKGQPTPGEQRLLEREPAADAPRRRIALIRRLEYFRGGPSQSAELVNAAVG